MSRDPALDPTWEWHRPHGSTVEYLVGQGSAGTIVRTDPEEPPSEWAKALLVAAPEMAQLLEDFASMEMRVHCGDDWYKAWLTRMFAVANRLDALYPRRAPAPKEEP